MNKNSNERMQVRYSDAFKLKVVQDIEKGKLTISEARRLYEINGTHTVYRWLRKYGKNDLIQKIVRIEMKDEKSQLKKKDERIRELESVIASLTLHNLCLLVWKEDIDSKKGSCFTGIIDLIDKRF